MTREEAIEIIRKNKDKPLNEIKRIIKRKMPIEKRIAFTSEHLFELIAEMDQFDKTKKTSVNSKKKKKGRKIEGEER